MGRWIEILENLYVCFRTLPFGAPRIRAVRQAAKLYLWDWSNIPGRGERFENLVSSHLLKYCHFVEDTEDFHMELRVIRDTDRREVGLVVLRDRQPLFAVECQLDQRLPNRAIAYFRKRTEIPHFDQVHSIWAVRISSPTEPA